jgi:hypothetical protein
MGFSPSITPPQGEQDDKNADAEPTPEQSEAQMRRALETLSAGAPARGPAAAAPSFGRPAAKKPAAFTTGAPRKHRFVQDGEVQVVHLSLPKERTREVPQAADNLRAGREAADRALLDAQAMVRGLQTKLAHAEIAVREAEHRYKEQREAATAARAELATVRAQASAADQARVALEQQLADQRASLQAEIDRLKQQAQAAMPAPKPRKPRVKLQAPPETEQEPVKWWLTPKPKRPRKSG